MRTLPLFQPKRDISPKMESCEHHMNGCCFDPKKSVKGFIATPCFGCLDIE